MAKATEITITWPDQGDSWPVTVEVPMMSPLDGNGVVLARSPWSDDRREGNTGPVSWIWLHRSYLVRFALYLAAECPQIETAVIWPLGVPPEFSAAAFAVGRLLGAARPEGTPALVTCPVRPPMRRTRPVIQHKVTAHVSGQSHELIVWELVVPATARPAVGTAQPAVTRTAA
jgi:hypothetical protein